ncbi:g10137 [Coccomyxa viridis]|uniref:G10137 protein n=1 Tax=Coccomyxa viridis TaxID=1274662 RepID=A0ABP1G516_9CHLO
MVAWLEHTQIRLYATEDRKELSDTASDKWPAAFSKYLTDLECPFSLKASAAAGDEVMDWLLHYAVDLAYTDSAEQIEKQVSRTKQEQAPAGETRDTDLSGAHSPEVKAGVAELLKTLQLPAADVSLMQQLATAKQVLAEDVLPALKRAPSSHPDSAPAVDFACLPLGFTTGDKQLDTAAMVLRMLYIKDLRKLQTQIDEMIVQVQEYTANPRIDSGLGVVGR